MKEKFLYSKIKNLSKEKIALFSKITREGDSYLKRLINFEFDHNRTKEVEVFWLEVNSVIVGWATGHVVTVGLLPNIHEKQKNVEINICVKKEERRKGYSLKILEYAKSILKEQELPYISFPWNDTGKNCYKKAGIRIFNKTKELEYDPLHEKDYLEKNYGKRINGKNGAKK